ncbi:MAG: hypothetical protein ACLP9L_34465 [Thermoguttaceae bacterium]
MNALIIQLLTILVTAGGPAASENALLKELLEEGVEMPDKQVVCLPAPTMAEGLNEEQQAAVLAKTAALGKTTLQSFLGKSSSAPVTLKVGKILSNTGDVIRTVNLGFVMYGDWNVLTSEQFSKTILKEEKPNNANNGSMVSKAGYLKAPEMAVRGLATRSTTSLKEYFLYTTFELFDQVELSATRFCVATKTPTGVIVAAKLDPRLAKDKAYPNQWRAINKGAAANVVMGPPQPYSGAAFYAKVTRLIKPDNAIFVEFHQAFYEPNAWFGVNQNLMPSELRKTIPFEVKQFRIKLLLATKDQTEKKPSEEATVEK